MKFSILLVLLIISSCISDDEEDFEKTCPYNLHYFGHFLRIPITITPHKLKYAVGDTIKISTLFSDSIYDLGTQQTFKIENFPFKPTSLLYRFYDNSTYDAGYRVNELSIDSDYNPVFFQSSLYADGYRAYTIYENNRYRFESQVVLKESGRYILLFSDIFQDNNGSGNGDLNDKANAITFEGKCPTLQYYLCSMIEGDDHLELFEKELVYLDEKVYRGKLRSIENSLGPLKSGSLSVEFNGYFGFEVE